jgi:hypothetical protein
MGFEYKIVTKLSSEQYESICDLLERHAYFGKKYCYNGEELFEFRRPDNPGKMPNIFITFEADGIYVCQNGSSFIWTDLDDLKKYLDEYAIQYKILDYSD